MKFTNFYIESNAHTYEKTRQKKKAKRNKEQKEQRERMEKTFGRIGSAHLYLKVP